MKTTLGLLKKYREKFPHYFTEYKLISVTEKVVIEETGEEKLLDSTILNQLLTYNSEDLIVDYSGEVVVIDPAGKTITQDIILDFKYFLYAPSEKDVVFLIRDTEKDIIKDAFSNQKHFLF